MKILIQVLLRKWFWIIPIIAILFITIVVGNCKRNLPKEIDYKFKYDSITVIVQQQEIRLKNNQIFRDSILQVKAIKNIYYDTQIKNFANPAIVSNDSISHYISKKIHNQ